MEKKNLTFNGTEENFIRQLIRKKYDCECIIEAYSYSETGTSSGSYYPFPSENTLFFGKFGYLNGTIYFYGIDQTQFVTSYIHAENAIISKVRIITGDFSFSFTGFKITLIK